MDRWNYDNTRDNNGSSGGFAGPFLMGLAVGIAGAAVYAAARSGRLGTFMEEKIHGFEDGAGNVKNAVVEKASHVVEKAAHVKDAVVNRFSGGATDGETQNMNGTETAISGGRGRSKPSNAA
jgi:hypothetical protein